MTCFLISTLTFVVFLGAFAHAQTAESLQDCFQKDSISCLQIQIFRKARDFFSQDKIDVFAGISLNKASTDRNAKSSESVLLDQHVEASSNVEDRENALESYLWSKAKNFFAERSLSWNPSQTARSIADVIPESVKQDVSGLITEGRGKKKVLKMLLPLLLGFKVKLVALAVIAYFAIALIAKKAILASLVSLAITGFIALKKVLAKHGHHEEVSSYHGGWSGGGGAGWGNSAAGGGWGHEADFGGHGSYSSPVAQQIAYNGQKHK